MSELDKHAAIADRAQKELAYAEERLRDYDQQAFDEWSLEKRAPLFDAVVILQAIVHGPLAEHAAMPPLPSPPQRRVARAEYLADNDAWSCGWGSSLAAAISCVENSRRAGKGEGWQWRWRLTAIEAGTFVVLAAGGPYDSPDPIEGEISRRLSELGYELETP